MALKEELLAYVPEEKRAEFAEKTKGYDILTEEVAFGMVAKSQALSDRIATPIVEARFRNFQETKLAGVLAEERAKVIKELAPKDETPEQKRLKELETKLAERDAQDAVSKKKEALRKKAAELGYDPLKAERLFALPDAEDFLKDLATEHKTVAEKIAEYEKRIKYGANTPGAGSAGGSQGSASAEMLALQKQYVNQTNSGQGAEAIKTYLAMQELTAKEQKNGQ